MTPACRRRPTHRTRSQAVLLSLLAGAGLAPAALGQEDPPPMLQWFETRWQDMERRMGDYFMAGYGATWLPPVSRAYLDPRNLVQNSFSAGYDPMNRFDLGRPGAQTAYGTETSFSEMVKEFHRAGALVYVDMVLNHNAGRQTSLQFQQDGGYPGFWMGPIDGPFKGSTANWGDFHNGVASGFLQSENPGGARYCLLQGDLVALVDINQASNNQFIRQPVDEGNPQNIPGGTFFNRVDPNNRRFYPDAALGTQVVSNPGMNVANAGTLNTGIFSPPCTVPARTEPATQFTIGRFNQSNPMAGDPVPENATGYMLRWVQWMLDVHKVDGFRIDAVKHTPSWFFDSFYDSVVFNRRLTPDGRWVTPYSFGESVEGNDFTFDRYIRMPNGRGSNGRSVAQDAFGNRDALDLVGAGRLRDIINAGGFNTFVGMLGQHIDSTDDGFNNGTIGVNHIFSHDNGSVGDGNSAPGVPTARQQGWYMHAYLALRPGQKKFYHNGRGINRTGGFWPRAGLLPVFGVEPNITVARPAPLLPTSAPNTVITNLIQLNNMLGRGEFVPRWEDGDVFIFDRRTNGGANGFSSNVLVGINDRYDAGFDSRTIATNFPAGTRLIEMTGNAQNPTVDPNNDIFDVITVGAGGQVTIRVPRNVAPGTNTEHNRGFVVYAPAIPSATLQIVGSSSSIPVDDVTVPSWRRRANPLPIISGNTFTIRVTTTNGDPGATNNNNADDSAVFRINAGFQDFNGNGSHDIPFTNGVVPGYEGFVTTRQPLAGTTNTQGLYEQVIDASLLPEGLNYISVAAFRARAAWENPLYREVRQAIYVDRVPPQAQLVNPGVLAEGTTSFRFQAQALDRQVTRVHLIANPSSLSNPVSLANASNLAAQDDRFDFSRTLAGLQPGANTILLVAFEDSGSSVWNTTTVFVGTPGCDGIDFNNDGVFPDDADLSAFLDVLGGSNCPTCNDVDFNNDGVFPDDQDLADFIFVLGGGNC